MSRYELIKEMQMELERLNAHIDLCIIRGRSYQKEARRHKFLTARLKDLSETEKSKIRQKSWVVQAMNIMSTFVL